MGLFEAPPADGMDRASVDVGVSAHRLVVSFDGVDQFGRCVVDRRSDHTSVFGRRQKTAGAAAPDADAYLPVSRRAIQCQRGPARDLAARHLLLSAVL